MSVYALTVWSGLRAWWLIRLSWCHLSIERLPWLRPLPIFAISLVELLLLLWHAWSLASFCVLAIPTLLVVLVGHLLVVLRSLRLLTVLVLLGTEIVRGHSTSHHGLLLGTAMLVRIIYLVACWVAMVPSTLIVHLRLASGHAALAHLLNNALHKLTGILKALELLGKLLVEWPKRQLLLTGPFWH